MPFSQVPTAIRVPLAYFEFDPSAAQTPSGTQKTLLIGPKTSAGDATANTPILVTSDADAIARFGRRSILRHMYRRYSANDPYAEIWALPVDDNGAGVPNTNTITVVGTATAAGTLNIRVGAINVQVAVALGDAQNTIASAISTALAADPDIPMTTAAAVANAVTLTAANDGTMGNDIEVSVNRLGAAGGERLPAGVSSVTPVSAGVGATNPALTTAITNMADTPFDFIVCGINDATNVALLETELNDRWDALKMVYGHLWFGTRGNLATQLALSYDSEHLTNVALYDSESPTWEWAAAYAARCAKSLRDNPAQPCQNLELIGIWAPRNPWTLAEQQQLLTNGSATHRIDGSGKVLVGREITTYQTNAAGSADASMLDVQTMFTSAYLMRDIKAAVEGTYGRHILVDDDALTGPGAPVVKPKSIKALVVTRYRAAEEQGIVENVDTFKDLLTVTRNVDNPNRVDMLFPPDLGNQFRIFAALMQPRLQFPSV